MASQKSFHTSGTPSPTSESPNVNDTAIPESKYPPRIKGADSDVFEVDPALDRAITRKFDLHVVPWLFGLWLLAFLDRSNIGNAKIDGLPEDLKLAGNTLNTALAVFYIPYILVDVPSNWVLKICGAGYYLPSLMIAWGIVGMCMGFVKSFAGLVVCRLLLGLFEGGLLGGIILYLSMFYRRHQLVFRMGMFYCAAPLSGAFGGLLATGLGEINYDGLNGWPWIFIVEGAITILFGIITAFFLPHNPATSKFLTEEERAGSLRRLKLDGNGATADHDVAQETFSWHWVRMAVFDVNTLLCSFNFFAIITPIYSYALFLPTIISDLGYTRVTAQLFTVPPNMVAFCTVILGCYLSDRFKVRGALMITGCSLAIIGYIMLLAGDSPTVRYGGTFLVAAGVFPSSPAVMGWLANNLAPHYVRGTGLGIQIGIANFASFIATFTYVSSDAPLFVTGHCLNIGMLALSIILSFITIMYVKIENRKRARGGRDSRLANGDEAMLGSRHPQFRYTI